MKSCNLGKYGFDTFFFSLQTDQISAINQDDCFFLLFQLNFLCISLAVLVFLLVLVSINNQLDFLNLFDWI